MEKTSMYRVRQNTVSLPKEDYVIYKGKPCLNEHGDMIGMPDAVIEMSTRLRSEDGEELFEKDVVVNDRDEVGTIMFSDGALWVFYHNEPAKELLSDLVIKDDYYCSTGVVKLKKV